MDILLQNIAVRHREELARLYKHNFIRRLKTDFLIESLGSPLIKVIIGPRRAGKSTIDNYGALLENAVFSELRVRGYKANLNLFYYQSRSGYEVDFLLRSGHINQELI